MQAITLGAQVREIAGKKVKKLRKEGLLPISVYGKDVASVALSVPVKEFLKVYDKVGETGLVELKFGGKSLHTLVSNVQIHPLSRQPLHVEFHAVKLTEKIKADVPVELTGEAPAVVNKVGVLLQAINEIEVEALPTDLPEKVEVDVTGLAEIDQQVTVAELKVASGVTVLTPGDGVVVKVAPAVSEETQKELAAEEAAKAATETTPAEGAAVSGETAQTPAEGQTEDKTKQEGKT